MSRTFEEELAKARQWLAEALEEKGADYRYPTGPCSYLEYDHPRSYLEEAPEGPLGPSCLIGHVLVKAGVPLDNIRIHEGDEASIVLEREQVFESNTIRAAMRAAQVQQDEGATWSEAVQEFERVIALPGEEV